MFVIEIISRFKQEKMLTRQSVALVLQAACSVCHLLCLQCYTYCFIAKFD